MNIWERLVEKLNPAQAVIARQESSTIYSDAKINYTNAFRNLESVNRAVSMLVNACNSLDYDVKDKLGEGSVTIRAKNLLNLLNVKPNPYQSVQEFRTNLFTDFVLEGNVFLYFDGAHLYHLPAAAVQILSDEKTFIKGYKYNNSVDFLPNEVAHFKDLSSDSIYRGTSRLVSADRNIRILGKMQAFQETFFDNGAVPGIALATDNTLSQVAKDKTVAHWMNNYNPKSGARKPVIIDSGLKPVQLFTTSFKDLDFEDAVKGHNTKILQALGVPPILLEGGNNANISPNLRLFYLETVLPIVRKFVSAMEMMTGYDIEAITGTVSALQPELSQLASYHVGLVNGGIITADEARTELRYKPMKTNGSDELRVPQNIVGSATQPFEGGRPPATEE